MSFLFAGIVFFVSSIIWFRFPSEEQDKHFFRYCKFISIQDKDEWNKAQKYGAKSMFITSLVFIILFCYLNFKNYTEIGIFEEIITFIIIIIMMIIIIIRFKKLSI